MEDFENYYPEQYNEDLSLVIADRNIEKSGLNTHDFERGDSSAAINAIPKSHLKNFGIFISLQVLFDELIFTYLPKEYFHFREKNNWPKLDFCGHGRISKFPWSVFEYIPKPSILEYQKAALFFLKYHEKDLPSKESMIVFIKNDKDIANSEYGKVIQDIFSGARM